MCDAKAKMQIQDYVFDAWGINFSLGQHFWQPRQQCQVRTSTYTLRSSKNHILLLTCIPTCRKKRQVLWLQTCHKSPPRKYIDLYQYPVVFKLFLYMFSTCRQKALRFGCAVNHRVHSIKAAIVIAPLLNYDCWLFHRIRGLEIELLPLPNIIPGFEGTEKKEISLPDLSRRKVEGIYIAC